jgi:hypothetical protein
VVWSDPDDAHRFVFGLLGWMRGGLDGAGEGRQSGHGKADVRLVGDAAR